MNRHGRHQTVPAEVWEQEYTGGPVPFAGLPGNPVAGPVPGIVVHFRYLARMHPDLFHHWPEFPRQVAVDRGQELHRYQAVLINHLGQRLLQPDAPGLAVDAGDIAKHVIQRHQGEAEAEHADNHESQPPDNPPVGYRALPGVHG